MFGTRSANALAASTGIAIARVRGPQLPSRVMARTALALLAIACCGITTAQVTITPSTPGWGFVTETPTGSGVFINGPAGGPAGSTGSIQITVGAPGGELFATGSYAGIRVDQLAGITYSTYVFSSGIPETANLQFDFDPGVVPPPAGYQGRAVFTPALLTPSPVTVGSWQSWNPMTQRAWWGSGSAATRVLAAKCPQSAPCTLAEILGFFPNSTLLVGGIFGFKVGNSNNAGVVSVDGFTLGTTGASGPVIQYRFALAAPAAQAVPTLNPGLLPLLAALVAAAGALVLRRRHTRAVARRRRRRP